MAAEMTKIEKEALKHATEYASYMTTVAKRAYYDGYLKGMKQKNLKIKVDSGKVIKNLKKIVFKRFLSRLIILWICGVIL